MKVLVVTADHGGCGHYRLRWPGEAAGATGDIEVEIVHADEVKVGTGYLGQVMEVDAPDSDVVVVQRIDSSWGVGTMRWFQEHGRAVVLDMDDALWAIDKSNQAYGHYQQQTRNWRYVDLAGQRADLVTVTTPRLAQRWKKHGRTEVIPNHVPEAYLNIDGARDDRVRLGWTGSVFTHPHDLPVVGGAVRQALRDSGATLTIVGDGQGVHDAFGAHPDEVTGWVPLDEYPVTYAGLDVAMVPLNDSVFNKCKSGLKLLEASALGVACVASPSSDNLRLHRKEGMGLIASTPEQWRAHLVRLLTNEDQRLGLAAQARIAASRWTIEGNVHKWIAAWKRAADRSAALRARKVSA